LRPSLGPTSATSAANSLDDVPFGLRDAYGEDKFPRQASELINWDWALKRLR
jgi:hypothetical protein